MRAVVECLSLLVLAFSSTISMGFIASLAYVTARFVSAASIDWTLSLNLFYGSVLIVFATYVYTYSDATAVGLNQIAEPEGTSIDD